MKALLALTLFLITSTVSRAQNAEAIMQSVRQVAALQDEQDLHGFIRKGRKKTPLTMFMRGKDIQFALDGGKEYFLLRLNGDSQELQQLIGGKTSKFPAKKIVAPIANSDISYEDLALSFLYWPNPKIIAEEKLNGQNCWRIHVTNPGKIGRYKEISAWVHIKQRALMRVVGFGPTRAALKQFEITDLMNVNGRFTVKTMKVRAFNTKGDTTGITYLDFNLPKKSPLDKARRKGR